MDRRIRGHGLAALNVLQRSARFEWHHDGKMIEKMCENLGRFLAMNEEARTEFLAREQEAMRGSTNETEVQVSLLAVISKILSATAYMKRS